MEAIHQAKGSLLDTLGCATGAFEAPGKLMCDSMVKQFVGLPDSTVFSLVRRTSSPNAALMNSFMVRFLNYHTLGGGHNSGATPAIPACLLGQQSFTGPVSKTHAINIEIMEQVLATLANVIENYLKLQDIEKVRIMRFLRESHHTTVLSKKYPPNTESI